MISTNKNILILDDNITICLMLKSWLIKKGFVVEIATNVTDAKQTVRDHLFDLILSDIRMPGLDGFSFLSWVKKYDSDVLVIMMTGYADIESAVESMKSGAVDYISKPIEPEQLFKKIEEAFAFHENKLIQHTFSDTFIKVPGEEYKDLYNQLDYVAENNVHRLIIGDRGTGKLSVAKYIYEKGIHFSKPFVILDNEKDDEPLTNYPYTTYDTNGMSTLMQKFYEANGGLLYIRQVGLLDINQQSELINLLTKQKKDDNYTQVIMSTDMDSQELQKRLIPKLFNLLEKDEIILPTLEGKDEVILYMVTHFLRFANFTLNKQIDSIDQDLLKQMSRYSWPGNIQELKNCVIKAALLTENNYISASIASDLFGNKNQKLIDSIQYFPIQGLRKENYEKEKIIEALELAKGNKTMAASILNIDRKTLYNKIKLYSILTCN